MATRRPEFIANIAADGGARGAELLSEKFPAYREYDFKSVAA